MCGIVWLRSKDQHPAGHRIWKRYQAQRARGTEGYGFVEIGGEGMLHRAAEEAEISPLLLASKAQEIMFHHRKPTSTDNLPEAAHPLLVKTKTRNFYVVHNGIISNADLLRPKHEALGFKYRTVIKNRDESLVGGKRYLSEWKEEFNDSEAFAIDLARYLLGEQATLESKGSIAFVCLETNKRKEPLFLHWGRNYSPLFLEESSEFICLKSQGAGIEVTADRLFSYNYRTKQEVVNSVDIGTKIIPYKSDTTDRWDGYGGAGYKTTGGLYLPTQEQRIKTLEDKIEDLELRLIDLEYAELETEDRSFDDSPKAVPISGLLGGAKSRILGMEHED